VRHGGAAHIESAWQEAGKNKAAEGFTKSKNIVIILSIKL